LLFKPDATLEDKKLVKNTADKLRELIINGEEFSKIAKEHSQGSEVNATIAGDIGIIQKGYMPKEFEEVAFAMKKGEVSKPVATKFGYHIIKVTDRREAGITPYVEVKDFIRKFLQEQESVKMLNTIKKKLREEAKIEVLLNKTK
jgi:parvulin-like peptidyl-prolyl isomerase